VANKVAADHGRTMDPDCLRLVGPMHLAQTREEARRDVAYGFDKWRSYFSAINPMGAPGANDKDPIDAMIESGAAVIGTPDDAIAQIERLEQKIPGFGCFLFLAHNWADFDKTKRSYELFARHVKPHFQGANRARAESLQWATDNSGEFIGAAMQAARNTIVRYHEEDAQSGG
jgi:limonene 1,2-monooxygenase